MEDALSVAFRSIGELYVANLLLQKQLEEARRAKTDETKDKTDETKEVEDGTQHTGR
ncbi:MAG: hypothetical protein QN162_15310 [Armatimonadota bacterium]|nr:hypothetical protein [Armatimonadota bacterium]